MQNNRPSYSTYKLLRDEILKADSSVTNLNGPQKESRPKGAKTSGSYQMRSLFRDTDDETGGEENTNNVYQVINNYKNGKKSSYILKDEINQTYSLTASK